VQVGVAGPTAAFAAADRLFGLLAAAAMDPPAAAVGDDTDFLDVEVDHVTWPASMDPSGLAVVLTGRVEEPAPVQAQVDQVPADRADRDRDTLAGELDADPAG
jgi:hypothetical protein